MQLGGVADLVFVIADEVVVVGRGRRQRGGVVVDDGGGVGKIDELAMMRVCFAIHSHMDCMYQSRADCQGGLESENMQISKEEQTGLGFNF